MFGGEISWGFGEGRQAQTHDFKMAAIVGGVLWAIEGTTEMKGGIVDEIDVNVRGLVILAV